MPSSVSGKIPIAMIVQIWTDGRGLWNGRAQGLAPSVSEPDPSK